MSLTNEQIGAAQQRILRALREFYGFRWHPDDTRSELLDLDAICEAARQKNQTAADFDRWLDNSPEWAQQIDWLETNGKRQLVRRAMKAAWEAARQPEGDEWYCPTCSTVIAPRDVTYEETHDVRAGGCGGRVGDRPRQPDSLVGRRVRLRTCHEITGTVRALASYSVEWDTGVTADAGPSIFELLEDTDAK